MTIEQEIEAARKKVIKAVAEPIVGAINEARDKAIAEALAAEWKSSEAIPEKWRDGRSLILAKWCDEASYPGYWEIRPNHWGEIGWAEEDARGDLYYSRHPMHPDLVREFPAPPTGDRDEG